MQCKDFRCVYEADGECEQMGGECIGDLCENFRECSSCQDQERDECNRLK